MSNNAERDNLIFIYINHVKNKTYVNITSVSQINITNFNWYLGGLEILSRLNSDDGFSVILSFDRKKYQSFEFSGGNREYDFIGENLFEYLQGRTSSFGPYQKEDPGASIFLALVLFGSIGLLTASLGYYLSIKNEVKNNEDKKIN